MAKTKEQQEKFIMLRSQGLSFDSISKAIGVSKPLLIQWQKEFKREIENQIYLETQELLEKYKLTKKARLENLCKQLNRINEEIEKQDYSKINLKDLFAIKSNLELNLFSEMNEVKYKTEFYHSFGSINENNEFDLKIN